MLLVGLAEFLYPGYSVSENFISDLGVGPMPSSAIFAVALVLFGLLALVAALILRAAAPSGRFWILIALTGLGAIGVAAFNENSSPELHGVFAAMAFGAGNLAAVLSFRIVRRPMSYAFAALGVLGLFALVLLGVDIDLGLGPGGIERMTFYPAVIWSLGFGAIISEERH